MLTLTPHDDPNDTIAVTPAEAEERQSHDGPLVLELLRYLSRTAVHTYAFSVAANAILSLFPFIVLMLTIAHRFMHSRQMVGVIAAMLRSLLPTGQEFVVRNMVYLVYSQRQVAFVSVFMLLVSSTGVFLPLEVALNQVWGVRVNRPYWKNQLISLVLAFMVGILALVSVAVSASHEALLKALFSGHTNGPAYHFLQKSMLDILGAVASVLIFFLVYWILPNRRIPVLSVLPAAIVTGLFWDGAKYVYIAVLPLLDLPSVYGPFSISVGLMLWAFVSGLILLAGAHFSASHWMRKEARKGRRATTDPPGAPPKELSTA